MYKVRNKNRVFSIVLVALLSLGISISKAHSQVILTGCADPNFCTLKELFDGGSIQSGDKVFENWRLDRNIKTIGVMTVPPVGPEDIKVFPIENGLRFASDGIIVATREGRNPQDILRSRQIFNFSYDVRVINDLVRIVGNELRVPAITDWHVDGTGFINIFEFIQDKRKFVPNDPFGGGVDRDDVAELEPTSKELVVTQIELLSGSALEDTSQLMRFEQTFKQSSPTFTPTPTPTPSPTPKPTGSPTAITLLYFQARAEKGDSVTLTWETATEIDNAGFNLYRTRQKNGAYTKINDTLIPARGDAVSGANYSYIDTPGKGTFYYNLEDLDYKGVGTMHGPEKVRVRSMDNSSHRSKGLRR